MRGARRRQRSRKVVGLPNGRRIPQGNDGLDVAATGGQLQPQAGEGLRLHGVGGHPLRLNDNGRAAVRGDDNVRLLAGQTRQ